MEQRAWAYVIGGTDGSFRVGAHRGNDLETFVAARHAKQGGRAPILWAETFRDESSARNFANRFRRWPYKRQAQMIISEQMAA